VTLISIVATVIYVALFLFIMLMWVRFVLDLVRAFARQWRPRGLGLVLAEAVFTITDPPILLVRRFIPPLRLGGISLDFAWTIVLLVCLILQSVVGGLRSV
jgi:YggT family protein